MFHIFILPNTVKLKIIHGTKTPEDDKDSDANDGSDIDFDEEDDGGEHRWLFKIILR